MLYVPEHDFWWKIKKSIFVNNVLLAHFLYLQADKGFYWEHKFRNKHITNNFQRDIFNTESVSFPQQYPLPCDLHPGHGGASDPHLGHGGSSDRHLGHGVFSDLHLGHGGSYKTSRLGPPIDEPCLTFCWVYRLEHKNSLTNNNKLLAINYLKISW